MKKILFAVFTLICVSVKAQKTVTEVIDKYTAAAGGLEAFNKITSAKMIGSVAIQGMDFPVTMEVLNGKGMRLDVDVMGQSVTNVYYNGKAWQVNPFGGMPSPTEVSGAELNSFKAQASLANNLMDYKARGHQVALDGEETIEGVKCLKIKLINKDDGRSIHYYIDAATSVLIMTKSIRVVQGQEAEVEMWYSDYKTFGGASIAMHMTQKIGGQISQEISWANMELEVKIDEKIFQM
jgi:hypothetical protein